MDALLESPLWYLSRSTGIAALLALTLTTALGVAATARALASPRWPRFATQALHRNAALLSLVLLAVHVVATDADTYVELSWWALVDPGASTYARFGVALGTVALDLLIVVAVTGLLRTRMPHRAWRLVHQCSYAAWPLAVVHFLLTGTDDGAWGLLLAAGTTGVVLAAGVARLRTRDVPSHIRSIPRSST